MKGKDWILKHKSVSTVLFISQCTAVFFSCANVLASRIHMLSALVNPASLVVRIWWIVYVVLTFVTLFYLIEQHHQRMKAFFLLMMGGGCNLIMLYSPIFGSRSSLYFVFFLFGIILILYSQLETETDWLDWAVTVVFCGLVFMRASNWMIKYQQVHEIQIIREAEIKYYQSHPDEDAWICRMPPYSVHGGDIEEDDVYHQETFKAYYELDLNQKLIFYWKDSYD